MLFQLSAQKIYSPDLGFHLAADRWMQQNGGLPPQTDPFTILGKDRIYVDLHWGYQKVLGAVYRMGGFEGLFWMQWLLLLAALAWVLIRSRTEKGHWPAVLPFLLLLGLPLLGSEPRPHTLSWVFLGALLWVLDRLWTGKSKQWFWIPLIALFWANTHSLYILGWVAQIAYVAGARFKGQRIPQPMWMALGGTVLASALTPYGLSGLGYPWEQFGLISSGLKKEYIGEFQSPLTLSELKIYGWGYVLYPLFWGQLLVALAVVCAVFEARSKRYEHSLLLLGFVLIWSLGVKNFGYFFFAALPLMARSLESQIAQTQQGFLPRLLKGVSGSIGWGLIGIGAVLIGRSAQNNGYAHAIRSPHTHGLGADSLQLPLGAAAFIAQNVPEARLINPIDFGGTFDFFQPHPVHIDGRMEIWSDADFSTYAASLKDPAKARRYFDQYQPTLAAFPYLKNTGWWAYLINNPEWKLVYVDGLAAVYALRSAHPELAERWPELQGPPTQEAISTMHTLSTQDPPGRAEAWFRSLGKPLNQATDQVNLSMFWLSRGEVSQGLHHMIECAQNADVPPASVFENWTVLKRELSR